LTHLVALLGVFGISFSAVFVRLAAVSPVTAAFFRAAYAVPVLALLAAAGRGEAPREPAVRRLAAASGALLALDLASWHVAINLIGVGLATVIANVQVIFVAAAGWLLYGERPAPRAIGLIALVLLGVACASGLARPDAFGAAPILGVLLGVVAGACYAGFLLVFRAATRGRGPAAGPLLDATLGLLAGTLVVAPFDAGFSLVPVLPAHYWLVALALVSQVAGWLAIGRALPRLPALETSLLLMVQPVLALGWGYVLFAERLSPIQWSGAALIVAGVTAATRLGVVRV
jgi:drug/metabolite transporter (DMT)-like permease